VVNVLTDPSGAPVAQAPNVVVSAGQTLDIGSLVVGDAQCGTS
jgi:hypothetical protein